MVVRRIQHPAKEDFPEPFQKYYQDRPHHLTGFPHEVNETCLMVPPSAIDARKSPFAEQDKKKVDEIHHCEKLGLIERKSANYGVSQIEGKFTDNKAFIESKYGNCDACEVGYCVLVAEQMSQKMMRELGMNRQRKLFYKHHPQKVELKIGEAPVFFVKRD